MPGRRTLYYAVLALSLALISAACSVVSFGGQIAAKGGSLEFGESAVGELGATAMLNTAIHEWTFTGQAGQRVIITASGVNIDAFLTLYRPDGVELAYDDDGGGDLNALLETTLPVDGVYTVAVSAYTPGLYTIGLWEAQP
jgi:hypothetical protein